MLIFIIYISITQSHVYVYSIYSYFIYSYSIYSYSIYSITTHILWLYFFL